MTRPPSASLLFPYTTLFRSVEPVVEPFHEGIGPERQASLPARQLLEGPLEDPLARPVLRLATGQAGEVVVRPADRSEEHTSELQSRENLVCRLLLQKKKSPT